MPQKDYECKPIPGFPGYFADTNGDIWTTWRLKGLGLKKGTKAFISDDLKRLKACTIKGYSCFSLRKNKKNNQIKGHRLIAVTFLPNPMNKPFVCHKNDIPTDNRLENLFWGTAKENSEDMIFKNRQCKGERIHTSKYNKETVLEIRSYHQKGLSALEISKLLGINSCTVRDIYKRRSWKHL